MNSQNMPPELDRDDGREPKTSEDNIQAFGTGCITSPQGRGLRPPSAAASRRSSAFGPTSRRASYASGVGQENDIMDLSSLADRLTGLSSPRSTLRLTEYHEDETEARRCGRRSTRSPSKGSNAQDDVPGNQETYIPSGEQDERRDKKPSVDENLLLENENLRLNKAQLERDIKVFERQWDEQANEIRELREGQKAAEKSADRRQQDMMELRMSKEDALKELEISESRVSELEDKLAGLRRLEGVQEKLDKAEWQLGDYYNELEGKEAELIRLRQEVDELRASNGPLERALQRSEQERDNVNAEMRTVLHWMEKLHEQQVKRDIDQFREYDNKVLERLDRREAARRRGSVGSTQPQHEVLGDFMSSRPQSMGSQSRASSVRQSIVNERGFPSRPNSLASYASRSPVVLPSPGPMAPSSLDRRDVSEHHQRRESRWASWQRLTSREQTNTPPPIHRRFELSQRTFVPQNASRLRHSSIPAESRSDVFFRASNVPSSPSVLGFTAAVANEGVSNRALSTPITKEKHEELLEYLKTRFPVPITWENANTRAVFEPECTVPPEARSQDAAPDASPAAPSEESQAEASHEVASLASPIEWQTSRSPFDNAVGDHPKRRNSKRPTPITTKLDGSQFGSSTDSRQSSPNVLGYPASTPPLTCLFREADTAELIKATGSSSPLSPLLTSPGLRRRRREFPSVTALGSPIGKDRDPFGSHRGHSPTNPVTSPNMKAPASPRFTPSSTTPRSPSRISLPASHDETEEVGEVVRPIADAFEPLSLYKRRNGNARNPPLRPIQADPLLSPPASAIKALPDGGDIEGVVAQRQDPLGVSATARPPAPFVESDKSGEYARPGVLFTDIERSEADIGFSPRYTEESAKIEQKVVESERQTQSLIIARVLVGINIALFLATMLALYTNLSAFGVQANFWTPAVVSAPASICPLCQMSPDIPVCEPCHVENEVYAEEVTSPTWVTSTLTEISTAIVTETAMETQTKTETETRTKIDFKPHTETEGSTKSLTSTATSTSTLVETHALTETNPLASYSDSHFPRDLPLPPPTRSFTGAQLPSFMLMNPTPGHPKPVAVPRPVPVTAIPDSSRSQCDCSCPVLNSKPESKSSTEIGTGTGTCTVRRTTLTASQIDARAAKVKQRAAQSQKYMSTRHNRAYLGRTYWGFIPEVQRFLDIMNFKMMELLVGPGWGVPQY
ncbi:hypothetical protein PV04_04114 [Phialophora macrospora]|uniref:Uncharacterized protein n=1 Tax=Phialophora macrospora TaxID=1851006 RepID=A0A0D2FJ89_9EURO|nr:hypothetical protein PV04_04114 [Phialophora macrospora]